MILSAKRKGNTSMAKNEKVAKTTDGPTNPVRTATVKADVGGGAEILKALDERFAKGKVGYKRQGGTVVMTYTGRGAAKQDVVRRLETFGNKHEKFTYEVIEHSASVVK